MYEAGDNPFSIVEPHVFKTNMFFVTAMVGGDEARDLLLHNKKPEKGKEGTNRKFSKVTVDRYAAKMLLGEWEVNPQPIVLAETEPGVVEVSDLNDGQQRLMGLVQASQQKPDLRVPLTFAFDAPRNSKYVIDQNKRRLPSDFFAMAGEANASQLSHAVRMLHAVLDHRPYRSIGIWRKVDLTPQAYLEFLANHIELKQGLQIARDISTGKKALIMPHVGACLWWLLQHNFGHDPFLAQRFFTGLSSGADLKVNDPRLKARDFLSLQRAAKYKWDGFEQLAVLIATANAWLINQENFVPKTAFNKISKSYPQLLTREEMPKTVIVPGNDPDPALAV